MSGDVRWLSQRKVAVVVGDENFRRGTAHFQQDRVIDWDASGDSVRGSVQVAARAPHDVKILRTSESVFAGECSCPGKIDCEHVAAVALAVIAARPGSRAPRSRWEQQLSAALPPVPGQHEDHRPLALQFDPGKSQKGALPRITLRPVTTGRNGEWVRTGVSWQELEVAWSGELARHPAREPLLSLFDALRAGATGGAFVYGLDFPQLGTAGFTIWSRLDDLVAAGIPMVYGKCGTVEIFPQPVETHLDLARADADGPITMRVALSGEAIPDSSAVPFGEPPIGLISITGTDTESALRLWRLAKRPDSVSVGLLRSGQDVEVPASDVAHFFSSYLPQLRRVSTPVSLDGSVELPPPVIPTLRAEVEHSGDHISVVRWSFCYVIDDLPILVWLSEDNPYEYREYAAEQELLDTLDLGHPALVGLSTTDGKRRTLSPVAEFGGMDTARLVHDALPVLRQMDVEVVEIGEVLDYHPAKTEPLIELNVTDSAKRDWFDLEVWIKIDGFPVPFGVLFAALAKSSSVLLSNGVYVNVDRPEFHRLKHLIEQAKLLADPSSSGLVLSPVQAGLWDELCGLGVVSSQSARWRAAVDALVDPSKLPVPDPPTRLVAELRPYQLTGYHWLSFLSDSGLGGILADDMGLGKTVQALALVQRSVEAGATKPTLVVAPTSVLSNWAAESARFTPDLRVAVVSETATRRGISLHALAKDADIVVTSYNLLRIEYDDYDRIDWGTVLLDEAQAIKNYQGKTYQCVRRLRAEVKFAISGTPMENNLMELWALLSIVAPGLFPDPEQFTVDYRYPIEKESNAQALAVLRRRIRPLMMRRTKEVVARDLPEKQEQVIRIELHPRHRKVYSTYLHRERQKLLRLLEDMKRNRFQIFQALTKMRQLALSPSLVDPDSAEIPTAKIDFLVSQLLEISAEGHRALVFSQFTRFLAQVRERLDAEGIKYEYLDGRTRNRPAKIDAFKNGDAPAFLISLKAGGVGLNLVEADYCFILDPWWNPASEAQAVDRAHRIGQTRPVNVYRLISKDTVEDKVLGLQQTKRELFARVMDDDGPLSADLTPDDLRGLLD